MNTINIDPDETYKVSAIDLSKKYKAGIKNLCLVFAYLNSNLKENELFLRQVC